MFRNNEASGLFLRNLEWWAKFVVIAWMKVVPAESTICNDRISLPRVAGCLGGGYKPPVVQGAKPPVSSSDPALHSTKKCHQKITFLVHFYLCAAYKLKGKIHLN